MSNVSDVKVDDQVDIEVNESGESEETKSNNSVDYNTYSRLLKQRKADQTRLKELEQKFTAINAEREAEQESKLAEQKKWQELAEKRAKELDDVKKNWEADQKRFMNVEKLRAFSEAVGGLQHPKYNKFVEVDSIELNDDGSVNEESLNSYAQQFRKEFPHLLKASEAPRLPNIAPRTTEKKPADLSAYSPEDLKALLGQALRTEQKS